jgi:hypothetical protein
MQAEVAALFQRLVDELPPGVAALEISSADHKRPTVISLKPTTSSAAEFGVVCDDLEVDSVSFGLRAYWEFPYERRYRKGEKDVLTEIEEMARAVIAGMCEEERGWFSITGRIRVGDYTYTATNMPYFSKPPFRTLRYGPYA